MVELYLQLWNHFGSHLFKKLSLNPSENYDTDLTYNSNQSKYVFRTLYKTTQAAALQESAKISLN